MKQTPLILSIIALAAVAALGIIQLTSDGSSKKKASTDEAVETTAKEGAIVWYDLDRVINEQKSIFEISPNSGYARDLTKFAQKIEEIIMMDLQGKVDQVLW